MKPRPDKQEFAAWLRANPTDAEKRLREALKRFRRLTGMKFRRQEVILGWIVDFYIPEAKLVIEVDGADHDERKREDAYRAHVMAQRLGLLTLRFSNADVHAGAHLVVSQIIDAAVTRRASVR